MKTFARTLMLLVCLSPLAYSAPVYADMPPAPVAVEMSVQPDAGPADAGVVATPSIPAAKIDLSNPVDVIGSAVADVKAKSWIALASLLCMAIAFYARKWAPKAHFFQTFKGALTLTIGAGLLSAIGEALYGGKLDVNTLFAGLSATASAAFAVAHPVKEPDPATDGK